MDKHSRLNIENIIVRKKTNQTYNKDIGWLMNNKDVIIEIVRAVMIDEMSISL
jgi:hypothetical protein